MEIQLIETQTHRETSSERTRVRTPERTRTRASGQGRVSFTDQSPGRLSEGSRHSAGSRHDGSYYQASRASTCRDPEAKARKLLKQLKETIRDECPRTDEISTTKPEILQHACNEVKEGRKALKDLIETYEDDLEPDTEEEARQAIRFASAQMRKLVVAKSEMEEQMREEAALQRRQGAMTLQTWNGETTGWRTFLRTAEILKKTYSCKVEQATKLKSILLLPEHKTYVDSFRSTDDPIGEFIRLLTPRYSSPQFLMAELEANISKIPDAEPNMSSKDLMANITKVKLQLMLSHKINFL